MAIREARESDVAALLPLFRAYCDFYESTPSDAGLEEMVRAVIAAPDELAFLLVAEDGGGEVVGFAACQWKWSSLRGARIVFLDDLFIAPDDRRGGHGRALIDAVAERGREAGAAAVEWLTGPDNTRAHSVYDATGAAREPLLEYALEL